jgi:hypothetical protein
MSYPYTITTSGLVATLRQLRSTFPSRVTAETLKKWHIASNNESTVLAVLRFLGIIDDEGRKQASAEAVFVEHDDARFAQKFAALVKDAYARLFTDWGDNAWTLDKPKLITFFRTEDKTSATVGDRQAKTFQALATIAGNEAPDRRPAANGGAPRKTSAKSQDANGGGRSRAAKSTAPREGGTVTVPAANGGPSFTVRIELNLPVTDDQEVYDKIFKSIRTNLY